MPLAQAGKRVAQMESNCFVLAILSIKSSTPTLPRQSICRQHNSSMQLFIWDDAERSNRTVRTIPMPYWANGRSQTGQCAVVTCLPGQVLDTQQGQCISVACPAGQMADALTGQCAPVPCPAGQVMDDSSGRCGCPPRAKICRLPPASPIRTPNRIALSVMPWEIQLIRSPETSFRSRRITFGTGDFPLNFSRIYDGATNRSSYNVAANWSTS